MNNEIFERLSSLLETVGLNVDATFTKAEISAYSAGLSMVYDYLCEQEKYIFVNYKSDVKYLEKYNDLVGLEKATFNDLSFLLSNRNGVLSTNEFVGLMEKAIRSDKGIIAYYELGHNKIVLTPSLLEKYPIVARFLRCWLPIGCRIEYSGSPITWDYWDALSAEMFNWNAYDSWQAPFDLIEHII